MKPERRWSVFNDKGGPNDDKRHWCVIRGFIFPRRGPGCRRYATKEEAVAAATHSAERRGGLVCIAQSETGKVHVCCLQMVIKPLLEIADEEIELLVKRNEAGPIEPTCHCIKVRRTELLDP